VEDWKQVSIGRFVDLINGFAFPSEGFTDEEGIPLIRIRDLDSQKTEVNYRDNYDDRYLVKKDDLLIGMDGDFLTVKWKGSDALLNQRVCKLISKDINNLVQDFLFYRIIEEILRIHRITAATTVKHLSSADILGIQIELPPKPEQAKIAEILSSVDRAIEQTEALIAKQQRVKTGLMQDLLTRGIDEHGNLRIEQTHKFKDSPLGRIPVEWEVCPCAELCREIIVGIVIRPAQYYRPDGVPVLRSANVRENSINSENLVFMSDEDNETLAKSRLRKGDMVTVRTGYPGTTAVIPPELDGSNCIDIVISRPNHGKVRSEFLSIWVNSDHGKKQVLESQGGLAQQHFNIGEMRALLVKVPDISEQKRIENLLILQNSAIEDLANNQHKLHSFKTALMQDLLMGKKRVIPLLEPKRLAK
jgi:type I restriction enzyme, S subunit